MEKEKDTEEGKDIEEAEEVQETKRFLKLIYNKELTWIALTLTCFIGLIELLPEIKRYGSSTSETCLTFLVTLVGLVLVGGTIFCFDRFTTWIDIENAWQKELPSTCEKLDQIAI